MSWESAALRASVGKGSGWIRSRDFQLEGFCGIGMMQVTAIDAFAETSTLKPSHLANSSVDYP